LISGTGYFTDSEFIKYALKGVSFFLASWCFLTFLEPKFDWLSKLKSSKFIIGSITSLLLIYVSSNSTAAINNVFGVDSGVFPYTHAIGIVFEFILLLSWFGFILMLYSQLIFIKELRSPLKVGSDSYYRMAILVLSGFTIGQFSISNMNLSHESKQNIYRQLAYKLDFGKHLCVNVPTDIKVIYLGATHTRVLVAMDNNEYEILHCKINS